MKFKKGSIEAKRFMAKLRAARGNKKASVSGVNKKVAKKKTATKKGSYHKDTKSHNVKISVVSGYKKNRKIGAPGDYAKFEIATIKSLAKLLKKTIKATQILVNNDDNILKLISNSFDQKITPVQTAKLIKAELTPVAKEDKLKAFVDILNKGTKSKPGSKSFPMKLPATVTIGSTGKEAIEKIEYNQKWIKVYEDRINAWYPYRKQGTLQKSIDVSKKKIAYHKKNITELKKFL